MEIDIGQVPREARFIEVDGRPIPLSDYPTLRIMRLMEVPTATLRTMRGRRSREHSARNMEAVTYNERALASAGGGRITRTHVTSGQRMMLSDLLAKWEGEAPPSEMVTRHNEILARTGLARESARTFEVHRL